MKKTSKALLLMLCAVLLVAASVLGTMAYLTSTDTVTNTFTVGNVKITLDEKDVDDDNNTSDNVTVDGVVRDKANSYKLLPGHTYTKDPVIRVDANSEDCYLFVKVANEITAIESTEEGKSVAAQMAAKGWDAVEGQIGLYVKMKDGAPEVVNGGTNVSVFDEFTVAGTVNNTTLASYANKTITVNAYAIQADGFDGKTASQIWTASGFGA